MSTYDIGELVPCMVSFALPDGTPIDPTTLRVDIGPIAGPATMTFVYGTDMIVVRTNTGLYQALIDSAAFTEQEYAHVWTPGGNVVGPVRNRFTMVQGGLTLGIGTTTGAFDPNNPKEYINVVRVLTGDTVAPFIVSDAMIQKFNDDQLTYDPIGVADDLVTACAVLEVIAAAYAKLADKTIGDISLSYRQQYTQVMQLITQYKQDQTENMERAARQNPGVIFSGTGQMDTLATPVGIDAAGNPSGILLRNNRALDPPPW